MVSLSILNKTMVHLKSYADISFSTDLVDQAIHHVDFLSRIDKTSVLKSRTCLTRAIYRYENYWLPLANDHIDQCLSAPIDIEWVWHCHMLGPKKYTTDCKTVVGHLINHVYRSPKDYEAGVKKSNALWEKKYPDVPFHPDFNEPLNDSELLTDGYQSNITYDILAAAGRQKEFYYNVSLPHYKDRKFLQFGVERYQKMLYLKQEEPGMFLIPCFDNDLIWHTHQANPWIYKKDMMRLFGEVFDHDDSVNERSEGSRLNKCFSETTKAWPTYFNENLSQPGAMYRGKSPDGILYQMSTDSMYDLATKRTSVSIDLTLKLDEQYKGTFSIISNGYGGAKKMTSFHKSEHVPYSALMSFKTQQFDFDTRYTNRVKFEISNKNGSTSYVDEASLNLVMHVDEESGRNGKRFQENKILDVGGSLEISGNFSPPKRGNILLFIERGDYKPGTMPENIGEDWGPMSVLKLASCIDKNCIIATHVLKNHVGKKELTARVMHCPSIGQSFVQVFYQSKLTAVAHYICVDQLPTPKRVSKPVITFDPQDGERAILIKNHTGDWAIVIAKWVISKKSTVKDGPPGSNGNLHAKIYKLPSGKMTSCKIGYTNQTFNFDVHGVKADLPKCSIEIDKDTKEVAESIALTLSLAILRDRCLPKT